MTAPAWTLTKWLAVIALLAVYCAGVEVGRALR